MEKRNIVNVVNFIRGAEPRMEMDLVTPVKEQIALLKKLGLKGTFLLQYDALENPVFRDLMLAEGDRFETGAWFECVQSLCAAAGVLWRGRRLFVGLARRGEHARGVPPRRAGKTDRRVYGAVQKNLRQIPRLRGELGAGRAFRCLYAEKIRRESFL